MPRLIDAPTVIKAAGNLPKHIEKYAGRVNSGHQTVSVARMVSPQGWQEPVLERWGGALDGAACRRLR